MLPSSTQSKWRSQLFLDSFWTFLATAIAGVSGIFVNILIARYYSVSQLGSFSISLSILLVFYLVAGFGLPHSVQKHSAEHRDDTDAMQHLLGSALTIGMFISSGVTLVGWSFSHVSQFDSDLIFLLRRFLLGLPFCTLNKIMLGFLNGKQEMKHYSYFLGLRYFIVLCFVLWAAVFGLDFIALGWSIPIAELLIFCLLVTWVRLPIKYLGFQRSDFISLHLHFGRRSWINDVIAELNLRLDTLILSFFTTTSVVGAYSFAADMIRGLTQISEAIQTNLNPLLTRLWTKGQTERLVDCVRWTRNSTYLVYGLIALIVLPLYPLLAQKSLGDFASLSNVVFYILFAGLFLASGLIPIMHLLSQTRFVSFQFKLALSSLVVNCVTCFVLAPHFGAVGAAMANSLSMLTGGICFIYYSKKLLGIQILQTN